MIQLSNNLFLLMANLSQKRNKEITKKLFVDGINEMLPDAYFELVDLAEQKDENINICTRKNEFGQIAFNHKYFENNENELILIQNAVQMLAVILERIQQEKRLENAQEELQKKVLERTQKLEDQKQKLLLSEEKFRKYVENAPDGIFVMDRNGNFLEVNRAALTHTGYFEAELLKMSFRELMHEDSLIFASEKFQENIDKGKASAEIKYVKKNGQIGYWKVDTVYLASNKVLALTKDIDDLIRTEQALKTRIIALTQPLDQVDEIKFEDLFDLEEIQKLQDEFSKATGVASLITHTNGTPITEPSNFCRLCNDIIRKTDKGLKNCLKSDTLLGKVNNSGATVQPCLSGGLWDAGASIKVGGRHIANWLIGQVRNEVQNDNKMRKYAREIGVPEDKFMEAYREVPSMSNKQFEAISDALFLLANQLSNTAYQNVQQARFISEKERIEKELKRAKEKAEQSEKLKSAFLANMSHEIRTPMNGIVGFSEMLLNKKIPEEKRKYYTNIIIKSGRQLLSIVNDVLDISKIETGEFKIISEVVNLNYLMLELFQFYQSKAIEKKLDFRYELFFDDDQSFIMSDKVKLKQVISNLLSNAFKFTEEGSITFGYKLLEDRLLFYVEDTGLGVPKEMHEKVFERFLQVETEMTRQYGGTGLGLSISKNIVELMNGNIWLNSDGQNGSIFYFTLPYMAN